MNYDTFRVLKSLPFLFLYAVFSSFFFLSRSSSTLTAKAMEEMRNDVLNIEQCHHHHHHQGCTAVGDGRATPTTKVYEFWIHL